MAVITCLQGHVTSMQGLPPTIWPLKPHVFGSFVGVLIMFICTHCLVEAPKLFLWEGTKFI